MARKKKLEFTVNDGDELLLMQSALDSGVSVAEFCRRASVNKAIKVKVSSRKKAHRAMPDSTIDDLSSYGGGH